MVSQAREERARVGRCHAIYGRHEHGHAMLVVSMVAKRLAWCWREPGDKRDQVEIKCWPVHYLK
jgi:hypothetical protein